jgi:hypothetical protein
VFLFLVDHIFVVAWIKEAVLIAMIVFMDVTLIRVHLSEPLPWRLGSIGKEGPEVVVLLCNILGRGYKISFVRFPRSYPPNSTNHIWTFLYAALKGPF